MSPREKLQTAYELAFYPPRLNQAWNQVKRNAVPDADELGELLDMALRLHLALPEDGVASPGALKRLALYQARARVRHGSLPAQSAFRHRTTTTHYGRCRSRVDGARHGVATVGQAGRRKERLTSA